MSEVTPERVRELFENITQGPWEAEYSGEQGNCVIPADAQSTREAVCTTQLFNQKADAEFIAAGPDIAAAYLRLAAQVTAARSFAEGRALVARVVETGGRDWLDLLIVIERAGQAREEVDLTPGGETAPNSELELPGMWERADFEGGIDEVRPPRDPDADLRPERGREPEPKP